MRYFVITMFAIFAYFQGATAWQYGEIIDPILGKLRFACVADLQKRHQTGITVSFCMSRYLDRGIQYITLSIDQYRICEDVTVTYRIDGGAIFAWESAEPLYADDLAYLMLEWDKKTVKNILAAENIVISLKDECDNFHYLSFDVEDIFNEVVVVSE